MANDLKDKLRTYLLSKSKVSTLVGNRIWKQHLPQPRQLPAIVLHLIDDVDQLTHGGTVQLARGTVQIDCYADTDVQANNLAEAVRDVVQFYQGTMAGLGVRRVLIQGARDISEPPIDGSDVYQYGRSLDVAVWHRPINPTT